MRWLAAAAAMLCVTLVVMPAFGGHLPHRWYPDQGQGGGDLLMMPNGEIRGVHVIQGGHLSSRAKDLNLDIGAGSSRDRGDIALNYDVGDETRIFDGRRRRRVVAAPRGVGLFGRVVIRDDRGRALASFSRRGIVFYKRPRVR